MVYRQYRLSPRAPCRPADPELSARRMPLCRCRFSIGVNAYAAYSASGLALCIVGQRSGAPGAVSPRRRRLVDACGTTFWRLTMARRSTVRRVEEFVLFDVLYEDGTRTSNRKVPGSELVDIDADLLAKTYIEAQDRQIAEVSGKPRAPIKSLTRVRRR